MTEKTPPDPEFEALLRYIQESRGLDFRGYKRTSLRRRITLRMEAFRHTALRIQTGAARVRKRRCRLSAT